MRHYLTLSPESRVCNQCVICVLFDFGSVYLVINKNVDQLIICRHSKYHYTTLLEEDILVASLISFVNVFLLLFLLKLCTVEQSICDFQGSHKYRLAVIKWMVFP